MSLTPERRELDPSGGALGVIIGLTTCRFVDCLDPGRGARVWHHGEGGPQLDRAPRRSSSLRGPRPSAHRYQAYGKDDSEYNLSISRYQLNVYLINKARPASPRHSRGRSPHNPSFQAVIIPGSPEYELFPSGGAAPRV